MEPRIQYAKTSAGVSIAFWTLGEGMPLVYTPLAPAHAELEWQDPDVRRWFELLSKNRQLIHYDSRGSGLSDRNVTDFSLDALVSDIAAVADRLRVERFALFAGFHFGPAGVAFAARHPERVSHLILWCSWGRTADFYRSPAAQALGSLRDKDWGIYSETLAHAFLGFSGGERTRRLAALMRQGVTQDAVLAFVVAAQQFDVSALLSQVSSPTLVLHRRQMGLVPVDLARALASGIQDSRLTLVDGESIFPLASDEVLLREIAEFLDEGQPAGVALPQVSPSGLVTILFTDVEGSTALTQRLGDAGAREVMREHERIVREALAAHGGSEVKTMGDGFMASFGSATKALECAIAMQRAFAERNTGASARPSLRSGDPSRASG